MHGAVELHVLSGDIPCRLHCWWAVMHWLSLPQRYTLVGPVGDLGLVLRCIDPGILGGEPFTIHNVVLLMLFTLTITSLTPPPGLPPLLLWAAAALPSCTLQNTSSPPWLSATPIAGGLTRCYHVLPLTGELRVNRHGWV